MKLELSLMELNDLYYVVSKGVESHKELVEIAKRSTPELEKYFEKELSKSVQLRDKIQTALYNEAEQYDRERDILKNAIDEEIEPEYDSVRFTEDDRIVNGQYRVISNEEADENARDYSRFAEYADSMNEAQSEDRKLGNL